MDIQITVTVYESGLVGYVLTSGKKQMSVTVSENYLNVLVHNAAHDAYRGSGKHFFSDARFDEASKAYKSSVAKEMIEEVRRMEFERTGIEKK